MGDQLSDLYVSMKDRLARAVTNIVPPGEIEDIVQETYVRACRASQDRKLRAPRSYMLRTARNLALDYVKRAEYRLVDSIPDEQEFDRSAGMPREIDTLDKVCSDEDFANFCRAVRDLPTQSRRAFVLKKVYGYTQREIAKEMKISEKTVEGHIAIGITRCKRAVKDQRSKREGGDKATGRVDRKGRDK